MSKPVWYLEFPTYRYAEDVKAVAKENGLVIVDAAVTDSRVDECDNPPALTLKPEYAPKPEANDDASMSKAELQAALDAKGIAHEPAMKKADLQALLHAS